MRKGETAKRNAAEKHETAKQIPGQNAKLRNEIPGQNAKLRNKMPGPVGAPQGSVIAAPILPCDVRSVAY